MLTTIYMVRHAHSDYTPDERNRPLSKLGLEDARKVTELLQSEHIDVLLSSPYKRAIQTIEGLRHLVGSDIGIDENFRERLLSNELISVNFYEAVQKVWQDFSFYWQGGESNDVAQARGVQALEAVLKQYAGKKIVIGTHGNMMVLIMNYFDKQYDYSFWQQLAMPDIYQLTFKGSQLVAVSRLWQE